MKRRESTSVTTGLGFADVLTIVFIVLKLTGVINWSWWWVLSPVWIGVIIIAVVLAVLFIVTVASERRR